MKYTLFLTQRCNLACDYCYIGKTLGRMALSTADRIIDFMFQNTPRSENIEIGFFGGEPLLEFPLLKQITARIEERVGFDPSRVKMSVVSNGTLISIEVVEFLRQHHIGLTISCDGPPVVQDRFRHFADGSGTSSLVERGIRTALQVLDRVPVNAVYRPETIAFLPQTVGYFSSLGIKQINLNPDFSARWTEEDIEGVPEIYMAIGELYKRFYREGHPHYVSLIDSKITVLLRGGYQPQEKCRMGTGEFAFTPAGRVFPCERLVSKDPELHAIGHTNELIAIAPVRDHFAPGAPVNIPCLSCGLKEYCVNWCGCSNHFMTGSYNRVSPFLCVSERASIELAFEIFKELESELGPTFVDHLGGAGIGKSTSSARISPCTTQEGKL